MSDSKKTARRIIAFSAVALLIVAGCSDSSDSTAPVPTSSSQTSPSAQADTTTATSPAPAPTAQTVPATVPSASLSPSTSQPQASTTTISPPSVPPPLLNNVAVVTGSRFACSLHEDGTVSCWGGGPSENVDENRGLIPIADADLPRKIEGITDAKAIVSGDDKQCVLHEAGTVSCWGYDFYSRPDGSYYSDKYGELDRDSDIPTYSPGKINGITDAVQISADGNSSCVVLSGGQVACWGDNEYGQLGNGTIENSLAPVLVTGITDAISVAVGWEHICAVHSDNTISCWGRNQYGQLGDQTTIDSSIPVKVLNVNDARSVHTSIGYTCYIHLDTRVSCWGNGNRGVFKDGNSYPESDNPCLSMECETELEHYTPYFDYILAEPNRIPGLSNVKTLSVGELHACAIFYDDSLSCWGVDSYAGLFVWTDLSQLKVTSIPSSSRADIFCVVRIDTTIFCWGRDDLKTGRRGRQHSENAWEDSYIVASPSATSGVPNEEVSQDSLPKADIPWLTGNIDVAAGFGHTCSLQASGTVYCWGSNDLGQLGNGTTIYSSEPVQVKNLDQAIAISAGTDHTCALHSDGSISCWGSDQYFKLGNIEAGDNSSFHATASTKPTKVTGIDNAISVSAGWEHTCAVHSDSTISCWGNNNAGQLGIGESDKPEMSVQPVKVNGIADAVSVSAASYRTCAVHSDGTISCWGEQAGGELAYNQISSTLEPTKVKGIIDATAVSIAASHTCALHVTGEISCWGDNGLGKLGGDPYKLKTRSLYPVKVKTVNNATQIFTAQEYSCALRSDDALSCWGYGKYGQFGSRVLTAPFTLIDSGRIISASISRTKICAVFVSTSVYCWGHGAGLGKHIFDPELDIYAVADPQFPAPDNFEVLLETHAAPPLAEPLKMPPPPPLKDIIQIGVGNFHTCALHANGTVSCWGSTEYEMFRNVFDGTSTDMDRSMRVPGISDAIALSAGRSGTCFLHSDKTVSCLNYASEINKENPHSPFWDKILGISDAVGISEVNWGHTCVIHSDATISCWGSNEYGQLGNGATLNGNGTTSGPVQVEGLEDVIAVSAGGEHTCALHADGTLSCWGRNNYGQLGTRNLDDSPTPSKVIGVTDIVSVSSGFDYTCAVDNSGIIYCWGNNFFGQLGNGITGPGNEATGPNYSLEPIQVAGISDATSVVTEHSYTCAFRKNNLITCWGSGRFGNPHPSAATATCDYEEDCQSYLCYPPSIHEGTCEVEQPLFHFNMNTDIVDLATGPFHVCEVNADTTASCWGRASGAIGPIAFGSSDEPHYYISSVNIFWMQDIITIPTRESVPKGDFRYIIDQDVEIAKS